MIVCLCVGVSERKVRRAIKSGAVTLKQVQQKCGAGGKCGGCHKLILELILKEKPLDNSRNRVMEPKVAKSTI